ncbi:MAG: leucine--tRNA ligase [Candidatus Paceibacterota bacterium]
MINFNLKNQSVRNCIIVHGSNSSEKEAKEGKPENLRHWKPWLKSELEKVGIETSNELYPEDWLPNYDKWKKVFEKNKIDENTVLVGHSAGTAFILRWLTENKKKVNKVVLVAPSIIKDGKYFKESKLKDFEFNSGLKNYFNKLIILYSDNDDEDIVESAKQIHSKLDGELIDMKNMGHFCYGDMGTEKFPELFEAIIESIKVFTTRPDTLFGLSYVVIAPENNLVDELKPQIKNWPEIEKYRKEVKDRSEIERTAQGKEKTGVVLSGIKAVNPVNKEEVPVFIADYVLANYGTGAVMAVPAHDERDYAFAKKYRLPMKRVIKPNVITTEVFIDPVGTNRNMTEEIKKKEQNLELFKEIYTGKDGIMFNSEKFNGMTNEEAMKPITEYAGGKMTKTYKLQDWVFSRQRYWGEPIPVIHCEKCGVVPVPEKDLPVKLPKVKFYEPTGTGESPLAAITDWVNTKCPKCGGMGKRETNTMPQWAGSSWYYLRYIDPNNDKALVDKEKERYWSPVDMYVGGTEHATRHLIYARFWHKFLYDIGAVSQKEPFKQLRNQGMILGSDNRKMSKRWGNVVNPDEVVKNVGADTLRVYESFMGPFEQEIAWSTDSMVGSRRFLDRVWNLQSRVQDGFADKDEITILLNKTIKKVGEDISSFNANTAISSMMILTNALEAEEKIGKEAYLKFIKILSPFAPHISEEIWSNLGNKKMIVTESWPKYDESKLVSSKVKMVVQVNGRVRGIIIMSNDSSEGEVEKMALSDENIVKWIDDKQITKRIFVKNKIINFVTE